MQYRAFLTFSITSSSTPTDEEEPLCKVLHLPFPDMERVHKYERPPAEQLHESRGWVYNSRYSFFHLGAASEEMI